MTPAERPEQDDESPEHGGRTGRHSARKTPPDQDLEAFGARLDKFRDRKPPPNKWAMRIRGYPQSALGLAFRVAVEVVSALAVGLGIGWLLDEWLGTRPWLMLVFIVLGGAAGILNVYRLASGMGYAAGYQEGDGDGGAENDRKEQDGGPGGTGTR